MRLFLIACLGLMMVSMTDHLDRYPKEIFQSPVDRDFRLSGTFGELRSNHFHAGLDIKSKDGSVGEPIVAAADGYVSRIKVDAFGYGNALYLSHPNGFTTLYGHLDKYSPEIQAYVKEKQYAGRTFELDLDLGPGVFPVRAGQLIGYLGNSGSSGGPHLHYEIRHTATQVPINPLHFGYVVPDTQPPVLQQLVVYELDLQDRVIDTHTRPLRWRARGTYGLDGPLSFAAPKLAFALRAWDGQNGMAHQNGIYGLDLSVDGNPDFAFRMDEIPFEKSRYLNAHIDYGLKSRENLYAHRCYKLDGNRLAIYSNENEKGRITIIPEQTRSIVISALDFAGNRSTVSFDVRRDPELTGSPSPPARALTQAEPASLTILSQPGIQVIWPKGTFYESTPLDIAIDPGPTAETFSPYFDLSPEDIPAHHYFDILIEGLRVPKQLLDKAFIARCSPGGSVSNCGGRWIGNNLVASVRTMGTYTIMADTIPPRITPLHFGPRMKGWKRMAFRITDQFPARERARDLRYEGRVDGQWVLFSLDGKTGVLSHEFDGLLSTGDHELVLRVTDDRGNTAEWRKTFTL